MPILKSLNKCEFFSEFLQSLDAAKTQFVFDLDSTIFNVTPRTTAIFETFCQFNQHPKLKDIHFKHEEWGLREAFERVHIHVTDPLFVEFRNFWRLKFFSSEYLKYDQAYPAAVDFVLHLQQTGGRILYLTGRDRENMYKGTVESLKANGMPLDADASNLYMKPEKTWGQDSEYKSRILQDLKAASPKCTEFVLFDNEPAILNMVQVKNPYVHLVYTDTVHSGVEDILPQIYHLKGWDKELATSSSRTCRDHRRYEQ